MVLDALNYMSGFDQRPTKVIAAKPHIPFAFTPNPHVIYATDETAPRVYATVELFGIAFTQGKASFMLQIVVISLVYQVSTRCKHSRISPLPVMY